ncbi:hypothetical protein AB28_5434 [Raoultella ornithinolytica 2-156-04_S1_C2]|nr:hypothetical protein AB00_5443 [Raoultella ornithinolytica 2-156-04_S1_C1]KDX08950.1 hypothetical protein AB28_5434 [Raoultella ornithinolytica 2-156-04_S1_C2]
MIWPVKAYMNILLRLCKSEGYMKIIFTYVIEDEFFSIIIAFFQR